MRRIAYQTHAYELAAKIPNVLHQQPCYCYCDRMGHNSLHSCFENTHGAQCATCLKELYYSYQQHKKGKTAAQIRAGIIKGDWKQIDLESAARHELAAGSAPRHSGFEQIRTSALDLRLFEAILTVQTIQHKFR